MPADGAATTKSIRDAPRNRPRAARRSRASANPAAEFPDCLAGSPEPHPQARSPHARIVGLGRIGILGGAPTEISEDTTEYGSAASLLFATRCDPAHHDGATAAPKDDSRPRKGGAHPDLN